jgi:cell division septum initiation protein DivIVA
VVVDEDRMLDLIDQMRVAIPEEIKKAQQIITQRDRILAQAKEEANRTLALAREKAEKRLENNEIIQSAKVRADQIIDQARREARVTQREADQYVLDTLASLQDQLERLSTQVRNGIQTLQGDVYRQNNPDPSGLQDRETDLL